jgi:hypothetical protein
VHIAVPRGSHRPRVSYPPTRVHVFDPTRFSLGRLDLRGEDGAPFAIYSRERSIADAFRLARFVGRDVAIGALRVYVESAGSSPGELVATARQLGSPRSLVQALEVLLP